MNRYQELRIHRALPAAVLLLLALGGTLAAREPANQMTTLTLKEALSIALRQNPDLQLAANRTRSSEIALRKRHNEFLPNLTFSSSGSQQGGKSVDPTSGNYTSSSFTRFSMNVSSSLSIFDGFLNSSSLIKARENRDAAAADFSRTRQTITFSVVQQYVQAITARSFVAVENENMTAQKKLLEQISAFYQAGRRPVADLYQQQAEISASEYRLQESERSQQVAVINLLQSLGMEPDIMVTLAEPPLETMLANLKRIHNRDDSSANEPERPDITAQEKRIAAARQAIRAARSGFFPRLSASAGIGSSYSSSIPESDVGDQLFDRNLSANVTLNLSVPIFDRGQTRQDVAAARVDLNNEELDLESRLRQVTAEMQEARLNWENAARQLTSSGNRLTYSRAALESLEDRYRANAATLSEVSQSRAQYREARYNHVAAEYNLLIRGLEILFSRGDGETLTTIVMDTDSKGENQ